MAAAKAWRFLTTGRISLVSWTKTSNALNLCERSARSYYTFNHSFSRGLKTLIQRTGTTSMINNHSLLVSNAMKITQSQFSTFNKQSIVKTPNKLAAFANGNRFMPTLNQVRKMKPRTKNTKPKPYIPRSEKVLLGPQRKGVCIKVFIRKPKKPNSAQRKCALLKLSNGKTISAYIPREKGQLQEHGVVLFEGGRVQDCPGIKYKIIRGKLDMN